MVAMVVFLRYIKIAAASARRSKIWVLPRKTSVLAIQQ